jgi:hypothetical protein
MPTCCPAAGGASAPASGISSVSFPSDLGMGVAGAAVLVSDREHGVFGDFLLSGEAFVIMRDLIASLCCGAVAGGVKFCTLNSSSCTFTSHVAKKVAVTEGDIYISTGRNSTFQTTMPQRLPSPKQICRSFSKSTTQRRVGEFATGDKCYS